MLAALQSSLSTLSKDGDHANALTGSDSALADAAASHTTDAQTLLIRKLASADAALAKGDDGADREHLAAMVGSLAAEARWVMVSLEAAKQLAAKAAAAEEQAREDAAVVEKVVHLL